MFEKGLVLVDENGKFKRTDALNDVVIPPSITQLLKEYDNQECEYWNEDTKDYFKWHYDFHII